MSQNAHLTPRVKRLIAEIHVKNRDYGPKSLREELLKQMKQIGLDSNFGPEWPGVSAVGKVLQDIRNKDEARTPESKGLDKAWNMLWLARYPVPPEALPFVVQLLRYGLETKNAQLTVREVKWAAQLYALYKDQPIEDFYEAAHTGALAESISEVTDRPYEPDAIDFGALMHLLDRPYSWWKAEKKIKKEGKS